MSAGRIQFVGINKDHYWQKPHKLMVGCAGAAGRGCPTAPAWGDGGGGVVPTHTWHRDKRDKRTQGHWPGWTLTPPLKTHLGKNPLEKRKNFEDDVNFDSLHF